MNCPQCGSEVWNNAQKNQQRVAEGKRPLPLMACKDKDGCGWVKWPPKGGQSGGGAPRGQGTPAPAPARGASRPLGPLYNDCMRIAVAVVNLHVKNALPADVIAAAATLFIAATRDGTPLSAPKTPPHQEFEEVNDDGGSMG